MWYLHFISRNVCTEIRQFEWVFVLFVEVPKLKYLTNDSNINEAQKMLFRSLKFQMNSGQNLTTENFANVAKAKYTKNENRTIETMMFGEKNEKGKNLRSLFWWANVFSKECIYFAYSQTKALSFVGDGDSVILIVIAIKYSKITRWENTKIKSDNIVFGHFWRRQH